MSQIVERAMRAGTFAVDLREDTPKSVIDEVRRAVGQTPDGGVCVSDGHVVVTSTHTDSLRHGFGDAMYSGRLTTLAGHKLSGTGVGGWLGLSSKPSLTNARGVHVNPLTFDLAGWVEVLAGNGLSAGLVSGDGLGTFTASWINETAVEMLTLVCRELGAEWRVNPDGTIDAAPADELYGSASVVVSDAVGGGDIVDGGVTLLAGVPGVPSVTNEDRQSHTVMFGAGEGAGVVPVEAAAVEPVVLDMSGLPAELFRQIDAPGSEASVDAAVRVQERWEAPMTDLSFRLDSPNWRRVLGPGGFVFLYFPEFGVLDASESASLLEVAGLLLAPKVFRVQQVTWAPVVGNGVFLLSGGVVHDLTEFVVLGSGAGQVLVGTGFGASDLVSAGVDAARFANTRALAERLAR